jgi:predicted nucleotidyltransferase
MKAPVLSPEFERSLPEHDRKLLERTLQECSEVIAFGSRSIGVHAKTSDLDLLCVGNPERHRSEKLDIVRRTPSEIEDPKWLGSELASHIATYGVVLRGRCEWRELASLGEQAVSHKEHRVGALIDGLWRYWDRLHPEFRRKYLTTIRREGQRLKLLSSGIAVPPTPVLDENWKRDADAINTWRMFFQDKGRRGPIDRERLHRTLDLIAAADVRR